LAFYCLVEALVAISRAPGLAPFLLTYAVGYAYTAGLTLWQSWVRFRPQVVSSQAEAR
jgi:hypothetical protein